MAPASSLIFSKIFLFKEEILLHLWRYPSLSIHGIEGAFHEPGIKTVIPAKVIGKFSIRQVPHMDLSVVKQQVRDKPFLWPLLWKLSPSYVGISLSCKKNESF